MLDVEIPIHGPAQLRRVVTKIAEAVDAGSLQSNDFESSRALVGQPAFSELDLRTTAPDLLRYYFECPSCDAVFGLIVETYHGEGGRWGRL